MNSDHSNDQSSDRSWDPDQEYNLSDDSLDSDLSFGSDVSIDPNEPIQDADGFVRVNPCWPGDANMDQRKNPPLTFTGIAAGVSQDMPNFETPCESFMGFIDDEVVQSICNWTNERAEAFLDDNLTVRSMASIGNL